MAAYLKKRDRWDEMLNFNNKSKFQYVSGGVGK